MYHTTNTTYVVADLRTLALSQAPANTPRPRIRVSVSRDVPAFAGYSFQPTHEVRAQAKLAWVSGSAPRWFTSVQKRSPTQALTGSSVE